MEHRFLIYSVVLWYWSPLYPFYWYAARQKNYLKVLYLTRLARILRKYLPFCTSFSNTPTSATLNSYVCSSIVILLMTATISSSYQGRNYWSSMLDQSFSFRSCSFSMHLTVNSLKAINSFAYQEQIYIEKLSAHCSSEYDINVLHPSFVFSFQASHTEEKWDLAEWTTEIKYKTSNCLIW